MEEAIVPGFYADRIIRSQEGHDQMFDPVYAQLKRFQRVESAIYFNHTRFELPARSLYTTQASHTTRNTSLLRLIRIDGRLPILEKVGLDSVQRPLLRNIQSDT